MEYNFRETEQKWRKYWAEKKIFRAENNSDKPKYYVLDMFPYPSGTGLHVGHPLGYIASDIIARFKRLKGFNVLHPMGYDSFGLPAEQYAIQTGQHPKITTEQNINRFREQLDLLGFSFDWSREVRTSDPAFYKWTQWIFIKLFHAWYNPKTDKAESIENLISIFEKRGCNFPDDTLTGNIEQDLQSFSADEWKVMSEKEKQNVLMHFRLAYLSEAYVNWCSALGSVLANDEVKDGVSERGGFPVERKLMQQWSLRITCYAQRLLEGLEKIDWSESIKESQRNWIGKSEGCSVQFPIFDKQHSIAIFTTRPDTIFGATFISIAPEHELAETIATDEYKEAVQQYIHYAKNKTERERQADVKNVTGQFTGAYCIHPFTKEKIPVWVAEYVLSGYGTGAVMGVPAHDERDHAFAKHFHLPIVQVIEAPDGWIIEDNSYEGKTGKCFNSGIISGHDVADAIKIIIDEIERMKIGSRRVNYRLRDAVFGRQRYWGEPIPVYYKDGIPFTVDEKDLPIVLPEVDKYQPTETGEPPLARAKNFKYKNQFDFELTTMPGWAGSSWYYLRYMDAQNEKEFVSENAAEYWKEIDFYLGGAEHATGHLMYFRFWTKFLNDLGYISIDEPAKKLVNQGMIQGQSSFVYRQKNSVRFVSKKFIEEYDVAAMNVDISIVKDNELNVETFRNWRDEFKYASFILEGENGQQVFVEPAQDIITLNAKYVCGSEVEKMSKSKYNVVNPEDIVEQYGADCLRLYEMFLGPLEQSKPWNTNGISGVSNFIRKLWRLYHDNGVFKISDEAATKAELKTLHKTIKKVTDDIERYSFNTSVSNFMICVNELTDLKCNKREILEPLAILISPYAPHIAEELWEKLGHKESISYAKFPEFKEEYLVEDSFDYPVSVNGKTRFKIPLSLQLTKEQIEKEVLSADELKKYLDGNSPKKIIVVPGRIVNVVI
jgi:leucyl-tRNA synthetase